MEIHRLGHGPHVSAVGLGCMSMSGVYGPADRDDAIRTIHAALDAGITLLDTGDFYGMGHNEMLIAEAVRDRPRDSYRLSVKFGALRDPGNGWGGNDTRPEAIKNFLAYSLQRLGTDYIDIYRPARLDPTVPIEETMGALADCVKAGWVRYVGLSEVGVETLRRASAVHPICDLQIEYALVSRGIEREILPAARELGIAITAYGILSRGLLSGHWHPDAAKPGDMRGHYPRFSTGNVAANLQLVERMRELAPAYGATPTQLAIAWVAAQGDDVFPLIGARRPTQLREALAAIELKLSPEAVAHIGEVISPDKIHGERYAPAQMAHLDSERH
ncbi:MAG: aldo/keto reductase [Sphingobium sp.]|nr:aldo/keto reductase [Sphingobium sp.]